MASNSLLWMPLSRNLVAVFGVKSNFCGAGSVSGSQGRGAVAAPGCLIRFLFMPSLLSSSLFSRLGRAGGLLLLAGALSLPAAAQKYRTAAGFRSTGGDYGITIQQLVLPKTTLEGLAVFAPRERTVTLLAERHFGILGPA